MISFMFTDLSFSACAASLIKTIYQAKFFEELDYSV